jgi:NAD(P)-dependent dehydrogenase (short-subunit alcohol dehydrogenase family)
VARQGRLDDKVALITGAESGAGRRFGGLDVVTTCAGRGTFGPRYALADLDDERWAEGMRANLDTAVVTARESLPSLIDRGGGTIVMIASLGALSSGPDSAVYTTAKTAILGLVRSIGLRRASGESDGITGTSLVVDNGQTALTQPAIPFLINQRIRASHLT